MGKKGGVCCQQLARVCRTERSARVHVHACARVHAAMHAPPRMAHQVSNGLECAAARRGTGTGTGTGTGRGGRGCRQLAKPGCSRRRTRVAAAAVARACARERGVRAASTPTQRNATHPEGALAQYSASSTFLVYALVTAAMSLLNADCILPSMALVAVLRPSAFLSAAASLRA